VVAAIVAIAGLARTVITPGIALMVESIALAGTAVVLLRARDSRTSASGEAPAVSPPVRRMLGDIYSVGALVLLDVVLFRRLEVYFLERSPDGLAGVAVLGLSLQIVSVALLVPTALLETWQPRLALAQSTGGDAAFEHEFARRGKQFVPLMVGVALLGTAVPFVAVPLVFPQYRPWLVYIVAFVFIRLACAGAGFYSSALYAVGRHRALYAPAVIPAVIAIAGNAVFTRQLGLRGALIAYGATQVSVAVLTVAAFYRASTRVRARTAPEPAAVA
jgi:O-antigen/teichoic acid export membrane protein